MSSLMNSRPAILAGVASVVMGTSSLEAAQLTYYIGVDGLQTLASGTYSGMANPNYNHLTFLYAHWDDVSPMSNHYHSKAIKTYSGPVASPTVIRSSSNFVPEGATPPIPLSGGTGLYAGKLATVPIGDVADVHHHWSQLGIGNTDSLSSFASGTPEAYMFNSSAGRWTPAAAPAHLHAEIVSLTPGLHVGNATTLDIGTVGDELDLTAPNSVLNFTPVLWTDATAAVGTYEAVFRFFDEDGTFGDSGDVRFRVAVVPEPASLSLAGAAGLFLMRRRRFDAESRAQYVRVKPIAQF